MDINKNEANSEPKKDPTPQKVKERSKSKEKKSKKDKESKTKIIEAQNKENKELRQKAEDLNKLLQEMIATEKK